MKYIDLKIILLIAFSLFYLQSCGDDDTSPPSPGGNDLTGSDIAYNNVVSYQTTYLRSLQLGSGALKDNESSNSRICPYFANYACMALLKNPTTENVALIKKYMLWYMDKLNGAVNPVTGRAEIPGSIYDYYGESETTNGAYDSVDSYAATFLMLAVDLANTSEENKEWLSGYVNKLTLISQAMERCIDTDYNTMPDNLSTDDNDGLSVASLVYDAKYLMDNCEVNRGLKAAKWLRENNLISEDSGNFSALLDKNTSAIESELWRNTSYNWIDSGNASAISKWDVFYPDAVCQLYPGIFGIIDPSGERANKLYTLFNQSYPNWATGRTYSDFPWTLTVYAAAAINDSARVEEYIKHINSYNIKNTQKELWYTLEAAFVILAIDKIRNPGSTPAYVPKN
jgi:hypothetical protein